MRGASCPATLCVHDSRRNHRKQGKSVRTTSNKIATNICNNNHHVVRKCRVTYGVVQRAVHCAAIRTGESLIRHHCYLLSHSVPRFDYTSGAQQNNLTPSNPMEHTHTHTQTKCEMYSAHRSSEKGRQHSNEKKEKK